MTLESTPVLFSARADSSLVEDSHVNVYVATMGRTVRETLKSMVLLNSISDTVYLERFLFSWQKNNVNKVSLVTISQVLFKKALPRQRSSTFLILRTTNRTSQGTLGAGSRKPTAETGSWQTNPHVALCCSYHGLRPPIDLLAKNISILPPRYSPSPLMSSHTTPLHMLSLWGVEHPFLFCAWLILTYAQVSI